MLKNLLVYRMGIFNTLMAGLMVYLASKGYISMVFAADPTGISLAICLLFLMTFGSTAVQAYKITKDKNAVKLGLPTSQDKRKAKIEKVEKMADNMSLLGIIGTVVGFIVAFAGIDPSILVSASGVGTTVAQMMHGMGIALYTTLTGAVLGGWTSQNYQFLKEAVDVLEIDEK